MLKYKHILLATDLMEETKGVEQKAVEFAKQMKAKLSVVHVVEPLPGYGYAYVGIAEVEMQLLDEAKKQLAILGKKLKIQKQNQHLEFGSPSSEIIHIAEKKKADLIIVGNHSRHGLDLLLGSTANGVIHHAKCDVLTVRIKTKN